MNIDKSWIDLATRHSQTYYDEIDRFLVFAYQNKDPHARIYCPYNKCVNRYLYGRLVVQQHLQDNGFWKRYKTWDKHGEVANFVEDVFLNESSYMDNDMQRLVNEALGGNIEDAQDQDNDENPIEPPPGPSEPTKAFLKLLENANMPLYPGSKK
ncbi:hypothetical protein LINPERHAP1_LOCUS24453, partial [Linum perenne]